MGEPSVYALILAGGRGTRFWPRSRRKHAKQVLEIAGGETMIQATAARLAPVVPPERTWILTSRELRGVILRQLPHVPPGQVLAEPALRNTAAAIGLAAHILALEDPDAVMGVFPSDHIVAHPRKYLRFVRAAFRVAAADKLVVFGIQPRHPETGFGYVELPKGVQAGALEAYPVARFREKPDLATARRFLRAGRFYWNSGMFFWRARVFLEELRRHLPKTAALLSSLPRAGSPQFRRALARVFPQCESISVDYAVLEKARNVVGFACDDFGWSDVGSWDAVHELWPKDADGNAVRGEALALNSRGNYVDAPGKLVALVGVEDLAIVDTPDALLVVRRSEAQRVGDLVKTLEKQNRQDLL
jgi:mannose-1-phosphate guanylyltransferase